MTAKKKATNKPRANQRPEAYKAKSIPVADLVPYAQNARTHSPEQIQQIAASIKEFGFLNPILVDADKGIIAGHGRVLAAQSIGMTKVPTISIEHLTDDQKRAYIIADNKLALNAGWDIELLGLEFKELDLAGFDMELTGFDSVDVVSFIAGLDANGGMTGPDVIPEIQEQAITVKGDTWLLGKHRVRCGDSTNPDDVAATMSGVKSDLVFTSPPYAQQRDYGAAKEHILDWDNLMNGVFSAMLVKDGVQVLVNLGLVHRKNEWVPYWDQWLKFMSKQGWLHFAWYVWDQGPGLPGDWNGRLAPSHEFIFHFNKSSKRANKTVKNKHAGSKNHGTGLRGKDGKLKKYSGAGKSVQPKRIQDSVFRVMRHKARGMEISHPAVFPVALVEEVLSAYARPGDVMYEPFGGSGTSVIACEKFGSICCAIDIDPNYVDVIVRRWQDFTGESATLEGDGRTFGEVATARNNQEAV